MIELLDKLVIFVLLCFAVTSFMISIDSARTNEKVFAITSCLICAGVLTVVLILLGAV